jgi:hypothetical protein
MASQKKNFFSRAKGLIFETVMLIVFTVSMLDYLDFKLQPIRAKYAPAWGAMVSISGTHCDAQGSRR